eukprot:TRINITY_DN8608_c0_g1_i1.p1 TRINITY_DN8608_c0_g1~~TRINITY_DN8608_c0_g1_i1.p1  ORF type:complete len:626 (-),score=121.41 TRINITY_DN8608_c0_g1_i1:9-1646(-)
MLDLFGLEFMPLLVYHVDYNQPEVEKIFQNLKTKLSTRELLLSCQTAFWQAESDKQKIVFVNFFGKLLVDLPFDKRVPFVKQISGALGSLITPIDGENVDESEDELDERGKPKEKGEVDLKVENTSPEGIEEKEESLRRARDKLLVTFLPSILEFYEMILQGSTSKELQKMALRPLIDFLPHLVPNIKRFHKQASKVFELIRAGCGYYPLDILRYFKDSQFGADEDSGEEYGFHYDMAEDDEEVSPISLGSYAYLLFMYHIDKQFLPHVLSPSLIFDLALPHMTGLLKHPNPVVSFKAFPWISHMSEPISPDTYSGAKAPPYLDVREFGLFLRTYIDNMVRIPEASQRNNVFDMMHGLISFLQPHGRYKVMWQLQIECPYPSIGAHMISRWKNEFMKASATPNIESPFLSPKILDLFNLTLRKIDVDLVSSLDIVIASLNFLRLLLYRGRSRPNPINIWSDGSVQNLKKNIIGPLKETTIRCLDNESRDVHSVERQKQTVKNIKEKGLPELNLQQIEEAQWFNLNNLRLIYNLVQDVTDILEGKA